jgi:hypothetical protein
VAAGIVTLTIPVSKSETADREFKVGPDTQIVVFVGEERKALTGKDGLKLEQFKEGATVTVQTDGECKLTAVQIGKGGGKKEGKGPGEQTIQGKVKKVDAVAGVLTLTVPVSKTEQGDKEFKIGDATKITVFAGKDKQEFTGKDGLKNEQIKEGATVAVVTDREGKVQEVRTETLPGKTKGEGAGQPGIKGQLKKVDAATGSLTVLRSISVAKGQPPEQKEVEYKIDDATKVIIFAGEDRKECTGKDGLKNEQVKEGVVVLLVTAGETKVTELRVGAPAGKKKE